MSKKNMYTTDVSDNKKINEKVIDTKEDQNKKNSINIDNETIKPITVSPTNIKEPRKDRCIPDWLPEKDNVEIVEPIEKPPHLRSKVNLHYYVL